MKWLSKTGIVVSGGITALLGFLGLGACCLPIMGSLAALLGVSVLFFHQVSQWFIGLGLFLIFIGIIAFLRLKKDCCK